jgi:hypothetical protein
LGICGRLCAVRYVVVVPAALAAVLALAGCSGTPAAKPTPTPTAFTAEGSVSVQGFSETGSDDELCVALENYDDIAFGAQVVISDAAGKTVALGTLESGSFEDAGNQCVFPFNIPDVPLGEKFYGVHVGNDNRGVVQYTRTDLETGATISIG